LELEVGDFSTLKQTTADAQGNFRFDNVPPTSSKFPGYAIMVAARAAHDPGTAPGSPGSFYTPALLLPGNGNFGPGDPIGPGTNVGTIQLRFTSGQGDVEGNVTSTDSSQAVPIPIQVSFGSLQIFTRDFVFDYPWIGKPGPFKTAPGATCPAGTTCASYQIPVLPTDPVEEAVFSKAGYTFAPSQTAANFTIRLDATSLTNGKPTCNPQELAVGANDLRPDSPNQAGTAQFQSCQ
jgi:hypothetical protein